MSGSQLFKNLIRFRTVYRLIKPFITHHHRPRSATCQAFNKLDGKFPVLSRLWPILLSIKAKLPAQMLVKLVRAGERAAQSSAHAQMVLSYRTRLKHRIESDQLIDIDLLQFEFRGDPFHGLARNETELFLDRMEQHQRSASFLRIMRDHFVDLRHQSV